MYLSGACPRQLCIAEGRSFEWHDYEKDLEGWWLHQAARANHLVTTGGEYLIVIDPGQRNDGPGPDIQNAHIILEGIEFSGAIEMHCHAGEWYLHGHDTDPKYDRVILHVVSDAAKGPDLPTLMVQSQRMNPQICLARRPISRNELSEMAMLRFQRKCEHLEMLRLAKTDISPLALGLIEILCSGPQRLSNLQRAAVSLGMESWPDARPWKGSNQTYPGQKNLTGLIDSIKAQNDWFLVEKWRDAMCETWSGWDQKVRDLRKIGLSHNQCREWIINILAPIQRFRSGFSIWQSMPVFRRYGIEKRAAKRTGLLKSHSIAEQQGLLEWSENYCAPAECSFCPLLRYHHTLA